MAANTHPFAPSSSVAAVRASSPPASSSENSDDWAISSGDASSPNWLCLHALDYRRNKLIRELHQHYPPAPALQTVRGFTVVSHQQQKAAATPPPPPPTDQSAVPAARASSISELSVMFPPTAVANDVKPSTKNPRHVKFVEVVPAPPPHKQTQRLQSWQVTPPGYTGEASSPPPPPPPPGFTKQPAAAAAFAVPLDKPYTCVSKDRGYCHSTCRDVSTVWCLGDKRHVPHLRGPARLPDGSEGEEKGKGVEELDLAAIRDGLATF